LLSKLKHQPELGSAGLGIKLNPATVHGHYLAAVAETHSCSLLTGCKEGHKNFIGYFWSNALAIVGNLQNYPIIFFYCRYSNFSKDQVRKQEKLKDQRVHLPSRIKSRG